MGIEEIGDDHAVAQNIYKVKSVTVEEEELREIMHRQRVSFSDCSSSAGVLEGKNRERYSDLEKMESRKNVLSRTCRRDSHDSGDEDISRDISNASTEAAGFRVYKSMVSQSNEWLGAQIYEKRQRVWSGTFNGEEETAKAIAAFKLGGCDAVTELKPRLEVGHPENRLLSAHSKKDIVDILISNSKNIDRLQLHNCSETEQEEEEKDRKGFESERIDNCVGGEDAKKATPWLREHMFEKTVTPSDVGKLNRLVIPKQHAEKYLPLDTYTIEKGLLLSFEDSSGKPWRFRYSYWNSSQSYVLTKGWSRFVKDKKLDAGDIVAFDRETHQDPNLQRLFISCRRKPFSSARPPGLALFKHPLQLTSPFQFPSDAINNNGGSHAQQLVSSRDHLIGPQWMPLFWPANNMSGESSRGAAETGVLRTANTQPMDLLTLARKGIRESGFPFSDTRECGRPVMETESSARASAPDVMQLKSRGFSRDDLSFPIENKVPEVAATSFDHSTSKKVLRLFGVDLECGK